MKRFVVLTAIVCLALPAMTASAELNDIDRHIVGAWRLQFTTPEGEYRTPMVVVGCEYQKYVAWYVGNDQPQPFLSVQLDGETLKGTIKPQERPDVTVKLAAQLTTEDQCSGTATYKTADGDAGQWSFTGKRIPLSAFDEVSTWKLNFTTPDYDRHTPTITVVNKDGRWYAWFSGKNHELPARAVRVQGDEVQVELSAQSPNGPRVEMTFRGTVAGDAVEGEAEYQMEGNSGSFPFSGRRTS